MSSQILFLNEQNFPLEVLKSETPVLVDFYANWCPPCQMLTPILEKLAEKYQGKIKIAKINIEENQNLTSRYEVMNIPTLIIFKSGEEIKRLVGLQSQEELEKVLDLF